MSQTFYAVIGNVVLVLLQVLTYHKRGAFHNKTKENTHSLCMAVSMSESHILEKFILVFLCL